MTTTRKRAPGAGRKPLQPGGAHKIAITLTDADLAVLSAIDTNTSAAVRKVIEERMMNKVTSNAMAGIAEKLMYGDIDADEARRINSDEGFTVDVGDDRQWVRYEHVTLSAEHLEQVIKNPSAVIDSLAEA